MNTSEYDEIWTSIPIHRSLVNELNRMRDYLHDNGKIDVYDDSTEPKPQTMIETTIGELIAHYKLSDPNIDMDHRFMKITGEAILTGWEK